MKPEDLKLYLDIIICIITIIGIPFTIYVFAKNVFKERQIKENEAFNALDDKYIDFLKICIDNSDIDINNFELNEIRDVSLLSVEQRIRMIAIHSILISNFEKAYKMYMGQSKMIRRNEWDEGWEPYIKDYLNDPYLRYSLTFIGDQWNEQFMDKFKIKEIQNTATNNVYNS